MCDKTSKGERSHSLKVKGFFKGIVKFLKSKSRLIYSENKWISQQSLVTGWGRRQVTTEVTNILQKKAAIESEIKGTFLREVTQCFI